MCQERQFDSVHKIPLDENTDSTELAQGINYFEIKNTNRQIAKGPFSLRVKQPPARLSTIHGEGFTVTF